MKNIANMHKLLLATTRSLYDFLCKRIDTCILICMLVLCMLKLNWLNSFVIKYMGDVFSFVYKIIIEDSNVNFVFSIMTILFALYYLGQWKTSLQRTIFHVFILYVLGCNTAYVWAKSSFGITYKSIIISVCFVVVVQDVINYIQLIYTNYPRNKKKKDETKGFVCSTTRDKLIPTGWDYFVDSLEERLYNTPLKDEAFAVGITSEWGTGKTTFLDMLREKMAKRFEVVRFNPWNCNGANQVTTSFFETLNNNLLCSGRNLSNLLSKYLGLLVGLEVTPWIGKLERILSFGFETYSAEKLKGDINKVLEKRKVPLAILIDDLDRLEADELFEVLRLIRVTANFKNVVFVVAYDRTHVWNMLKAKNIEDGETYIKKIFQMDINLPQFEEYLLPQLVKNEISSHIKNRHVRDRILISTQMLNQNGEFVVSQYLSTFRDVKRFANNFIQNFDVIFKSTSFKEVDVQDFFWLEVIRYCYPDFYDFIKIHPNRFFTKGKDGNGKTCYTISDEHLKELDKIKDVANIKPILMFLFGNNNSGKEQNDDCLIRYPNNYHKYFFYRVSSLKISNTAWNELLNADNIDIVDDTINNWKMRFDLIPGVIEIFNSFDVRKENDAKRKRNYIRALIRIVNYILPYDHEDFLTMASNTLKEGWSSYFVEGEKDDLQNEVCSWVKEELSLSYCQHYFWNKLFAYITPYVVFGSPSGATTQKVGVLTKEQCEQLAIENFQHISDLLGDMRPSDIFKKEGMLNRLLIENKYLSSVANDGSCANYNNLLLDWIMNAFRDKSKNNFVEYAKEVGVHKVNKNSEKAIEDWRKTIHAVFGNDDKYRDFIESCFDSTIEERRIHYSSVGISNETIYVNAGLCNHKQHVIIFD